MDFMKIAQSLFTVMLLSIGQVLFKIASLKIETSGRGVVLALLINPAFIAAMIIYSIATIMWILLLRSAPLNQIYPFAAFAFVMVPIMAHIILGEQLGWGTFFGAGLIISGVYVSLR